MTQNNKYKRNVIFFQKKRSGDGDVWLISGTMEFHFEKYVKKKANSHLKNLHGQVNGKQHTPEEQCVFNWICYVNWLWVPIWGAWIGWNRKRRIINHGRQITRVQSPKKWSPLPGGVSGITFFPLQPYSTHPPLTKRWLLEIFTVAFADNQLTKSPKIYNQCQTMLI